MTTEAGYLVLPIAAQRWVTVVLHVRESHPQHVLGRCLDDLAGLPASPCLSSRVETGIRIDAQSLRAIYRAEQLIQDLLSPATLRCRLRHDAVVVELDADTLARLDADSSASLGNAVRGLFQAVGVEHQVQFRVYRMGSAFLRAAV